MSEGGWCTYQERKFFYIKTKTKGLKYFDIFCDNLSGKLNFQTDIHRSLYKNEFIHIRMPKRMQNFQ